MSLFGHEFVTHALIAGSFIAVASGLISYFVVLRNDVFSSDALSHVAFTGALLALLFGTDLRSGLYIGPLLATVLLSVLGRGKHIGDVVVGTLFAWVLGIGALALSLYTTSLSSTNATGGITVLFGSIFGISDSSVKLSILISVGIVLVLTIISRPLLFASLDNDIARVRGVPTRLLGFVFLLLLVLCVGETSTAVGTLPLLGLLATPGAAAQRLAVRPCNALWLSVAIALLAIWGGVFFSYSIPKIPPSFSIVAVAFVIYLLACISDQFINRSHSAVSQ